jgi:Flp pilus assembly protein CpaB
MALVARRRVWGRGLSVRRVGVRGPLGIVVAVGSALVLLWLYQTHQPQQVEVLRAGRDVPAGTVLRADDLEPVSEPLPADLASTLVPASARGQLVGQRVPQALNAGELVTRRRLEAPARQIPADQRVYTLDVPAETVTSVDLQAGDQIEVAVVTNPNQPTQASSQLILDRVTIYRVDLPTGGGSPFGAAERSGVTPGARTAGLVLLVNETQFESLIKADTTGVIKVALLAQEATP